MRWGENKCQGTAKGGKHCHRGTKHKTVGDCVLDFFWIVQAFIKLVSIVLLHILGLTCFIAPCLIVAMLKARLASDKH